MNSNLNRDACGTNICDIVRRKEAAAYYGDAPIVDQFGYSHLSNSADGQNAEPVLVLMHPAMHPDENLTRVVPQDVPFPPKLTVAMANTHTSSQSHQTRIAMAPSSAIAQLKAAIEAVLGGTATDIADVERIKAERFEVTGGKKFRGVTRHKRTLRFEAHIWESKKQIYLGGFESELLAARSHDIMALKCKGLEWGALNFDKGDYEAVIGVLGLVQKEDIIYCLRDFSKLFGEAGDCSGCGSGGSVQSHATHGLHSHHTHPTKGAHALKPSLKIRKHSEHINHGHHHSNQGNHYLPRTPDAPFQSPFNSNGPAPITPKDKALTGIAIGDMGTMGEVDPMGNMDSIDAEDRVDVGLFDPIQPVDALCERGVFLPDNANVQDTKGQGYQDPFSIFYDSLESSGCEDDHLDGLTSGDMLGNAWQWSHC